MTRAGCALVVVSAITLAASASAQVYRYVDETGEVHYTDQPQLVPNPQRLDLEPAPEGPPPEEDVPGVSLAKLEAEAARTRRDGPAEEALELYLALAREAKLARELSRASRAYKAASELCEAMSGPEDARAVVYFRNYTAVLRALGKHEEAQGEEDARMARIVGPAGGEPDPTPAAPAPEPER